MTIETNVRAIFAMESPIEIKINGEVELKIGEDLVADSLSHYIYIDAKTTHEAAVALAEHLIESSSKISRKRIGEIATEQFKKRESEDG